jgi:hypothetical protein
MIDASKHRVQGGRLLDPKPCDMRASGRYFRGDVGAVGSGVTPDVLGEGVVVFPPGAGAGVEFGARDAGA